MGNNTSSPMRNTAGRRHSTKLSNKINMKVIHGNSINIRKRSTPTVSGVNKVEVNGEFSDSISTKISPSELTSVNTDHDSIRTDRERTYSQGTNDLSMSTTITSDSSFSGTSSLENYNNTLNSALQPATDLGITNRSLDEQKIQITHSNKNVDNTIKEESDNNDSFKIRRPNMIRSATDTELIPVLIKWKGDGSEKDVYIVGDFTNWNKKLKLVKSVQDQNQLAKNKQLISDGLSQLSMNENDYEIVLNLTTGVHKAQFLVNNEIKISDSLPMATDNEGTIVNWFEVYKKANIMNDGNDQTISNDALAKSGITSEIGNPVQDDKLNEKLIIEAGVVEQQRLIKKTQSLDAVSKKRDRDISPMNPIVSSSPMHSGDVSPSISSGRSRVTSPSPSKISQNKNFPYSMNQRHFSSQSTNSQSTYYKHNNSSNNSVSTYLPTKIPKKILEYTTELPELYYDQEFMYPYSFYTDDHGNTCFDDTAPIDYDDYLSNNLQLTPPPALPAYLDSLLINDGYHSSKNNKLNDLNVDKYSALNYSGLDNVPNHVILNHLMTTNIKHNVMVVGVINRYEGKFIYQALFSPVD
ncbi:hypothetical protein PACTADRAFT_51749 [Pachysolen tannophilus NRRL Y-2460]|uniref:Association with the SNF1 complex (ASC) domain-containing protein n=1 Tax=Pachysolen tannophilus NRRL Y-2460 TaxID=669874 RepID=A0A1E4TQJ6_PACTA|nr:hypothetical protein PACTADRAFT_51749 [Pachysolen tannophilus NRRL Y-2460]